ncbi:MAG TPA: ABC transporter ATP-binding protein, partial [Thermoleophilia bacterium]|nr:ABC transporter ATP-binding protein [Thermoleophilia bacterium]
DPAQREGMLELIRHVGDDLGMDVLLSSHLLEEVERVSDAVIILDGGVVAVGGVLKDLRGGGDELIVEVDSGADQLAAALPGAERIGPARLLVPLADATTYDVVRDAVAELGIGLRRLQLRTASLEEIYLEAADRVRAAP